MTVGGGKGPLDYDFEVSPAYSRGWGYKELWNMSRSEHSQEQVSGLMIWLNKGGEHGLRQYVRVGYSHQRFLHKETLMQQLENMRFFEKEAQ